MLEFYPDPDRLAYSLSAPIKAFDRLIRVPEGVSTQGKEVLTPYIVHARYEGIFSKYGIAETLELPGMITIDRANEGDVRESLTKELSRDLPTIGVWSLGPFNLRGIRPWYRRTLATKPEGEYWKNAQEGARVSIDLNNYALGKSAKFDFSPESCRWQRRWHTDVDGHAGGEESGAASWQDLSDLMHLAKFIEKIVSGPQTSVAHRLLYHLNMMVMFGASGFVAYARSK